jgi:apolipoprotein D and lipocalin family protein
MAMGSACAHTPAGPQLRTVERADLQRHAVEWYEIATIPMSFQKGCVGVTATYTIRQDGDVDVVNAAERRGLGRRALPLWAATFAAFDACSPCAP